MKDIWVIEDGQYSDYMVIGVFSSEENALLIQQRVGGEVSKWQLDPAVDEIRKGMLSWRVLMLRNGDTERVQFSDLFLGELSNHSHIWRRTQAAAYMGKGIPDVLDATVWAKSREHAVKIVNEIRTRMIANNEW